MVSESFWVEMRFLVKTGLFRILETVVEIMVLENILRDELTRNFLAQMADASLASSIKVFERFHNLFLERKILRMNTQYKSGLFTNLF